MVVYADTSFLISLYGRDASSAAAQQLAGTLDGPFAFTPLHRHEARNALRLAVFRKDITPKQCRAVLDTMEQDERTGVLANSPVSSAEVFAVAETLSASHAQQLGTRAIGVLHVAAAAELGITELLTFDSRQNGLAVRAGMSVPPE